MAFTRSYATRRQGTRGGRKPTRRNRASIKTRVKYQRPTARAQQSQIASLARMAVKNSKILNASKVYTDWYEQEKTDYVGTTSVAIPLTNLATWRPGARTNAVVDREMTTFVREMQFNYCATAARLEDPMYLSMFIVSIRPTAAATPIPSPLISQTNPPVANADYTSQGTLNSILLNSSKYKVHWTRFFHIFPANQTPINQGDEPIPWGNPSTTYRRGRVTLKLNWSARAVGGGVWRDLTINNLSPSKRLYLIIASSSDTPASSGTTWELGWGTKFTCINDN